MFTLMGVVFIAFGLISQIPFMRAFLLVFGVVVHGLSAFFVMLAYSTLSGVTAWLIYQREFSGWLLAVSTFSLGVISGAITLARFDLVQLYQQLGMNDQALQMFQPGHRFLLIASLAATVPYVLFLFYTKRFFPARNA